MIRARVTPALNAEALARFWAYVEKGEGCWTWKGGPPHGYATFSVRSVAYRASRVAWELANGTPMEPEMQACHTCDNPRCVRPDHIFPGTPADNVRDMVRKGRCRNRPKVRCKHGHDFTPDNTGPIVKGGKTCRQCERDKAERYRRRFPKPRAALEQRGLAVGATGYRGVSAVPRGYQALIFNEGRRRYLGTFTTPEEAAAAYDAACVRLRGERACTNASLMSKGTVVETERRRDGSKVLVTAGVAARMGV